MRKGILCKKECLVSTLAVEILKISLLGCVNANMKRELELVILK